MSARAELLERARARIREASPDEVRARLGATPSPLLLDVREAEEVATGAIPGALHLPRGLLELRIEDHAPDRDREVIVYCAGGHRSALAAVTLGELGYRRVLSLAGGFEAYKAAGLPWSAEPGLTAAQRVRYARHLLLPGVGEAGQRRLLAARVLLVGAGGLGSPVALYLAAAGVGTLGIVDPDVVDLSNLQRQILHRHRDAGVPKVDSAERALTDLDPGVRVVKYRERLDAASAPRILDAGWDAVVDGTDAFAVRYLLNDACAARGLPVVHGSIFRFEGQVTVLAPARGGPCYRCLYPAPPAPGTTPGCAEAGVLGALPGLVGAAQAVETLKLLLGIGEPLVGRILQLDALRMEWLELRAARDPRCPACGDGRA